jgi:hypothetical protein
VDVEWHENVGFVPKQGGREGEPPAPRHELDDVELAHRLDQLEQRQLRIGEIAASVEALAAVVARLNSELVHAGVLSAREALENQDQLGAIARTVSERR